MTGTAESAPRRVGVLVSATDPVVEHDFQRFLPDRFSFHVGRLDMPESAGLAASDSLQMMCDSAPMVARKVAMAEVEYFLFACTSASFLHGQGWDVEVARSIRDATDVRATTAATAVADALDALGQRRVFLATPYSVEVNEKEVAFLASRGIKVKGQYSFGCKLSRDVSHVPPGRIRKELLARREEIAEAGAVAKDEESRLLWSAMETIPSEQQMALELAYWEGLAGPEIATVLGVEAGTVRSRLARARSTLRERLAAQMGDPDAAATLLARVSARGQRPP